MYNVLAVVDGYPSTGYVPAVTYSCELVADRSGCSTRLDIVQIIVAVVGGLIAVFLLFGAHRLFHVEVYVFSSLIFLAVWYIIVANVLSHNAEGQFIHDVELIIIILPVLQSLHFMCSLYSGITKTKFI